MVNWRSCQFHDQRACCVISKRTCAHLWVHACVGHKMSCAQGECECTAILRQQKQLCHGPKKKHGLKWHSNLREFFWIPAAPIDGLLACFHFAQEQIRSNRRKRFTSPTWRICHFNSNAQGDNSVAMGDDTDWFNSRHAQNTPMNK